MKRTNQLFMSVAASVMLLCSSVCYADGQVCKISGANDNVEVFSSWINNTNSEVVVTVGNDSQNISANVTVNVEVTYRCNSNSSLVRTTPYTGRGLAKPNGETQILIPIARTHPDNKCFDAVSVDVKSISGTKCL